MFAAFVRAESTTNVAEAHIYPVEVIEYQGGTFLRDGGRVRTIYSFERVFSERQQAVAWAADELDRHAELCRQRAVTLRGAQP